MLLKRLGLGLFGLLAGISCQAALIPIDGFDPGLLDADANITLVLLGGDFGPTVDGADAAPGAIGTRVSTLTRITGTSILSGTANLPAGVFSISAGDDLGLGDAEIVGEITLNYTGFVEDLTDGDVNSGITIVLVSVDAATESSTVTFELTDTSDVVHSQTVALPAVVGPMFFPFLGFSNGAITSATPIKEINVVIRFDNAADFNIDLVGSGIPLTPEPASMTLALIGLGGLGYVRLRKRKLQLAA